MPYNDNFKTEHQRLELRAQQLRQEITGAQVTAPERQHEVTDSKDDASNRALDTVRDAELERDLAELRAVDQALERLARGSYGKCADCGVLIDPDRLLAQPTAIRCTLCQSAAEPRTQAHSHQATHRTTQGVG